jgi:Starch-binding associating with outer membrane
MLLKNKFLATCLLATAIFASGCKDAFDINTDPDNPSDVPPAQILAAIEGEMGYSTGGELSRYTAVLAQHATGDSRQWKVVNNYTIVPADMDNVWRLSIYAGYLNDLRLLKEKSDAGGYNRYAGVARTLNAMGLMMTTDLWNDIPYSEAFKGADNLKPKFDTQSDIYKTIQKELDDAIVLLSNPVPGGLKPAADDFIFGGDAAKWLKFAHTLKARAYLHTADRDGAANYTKALAELAMGINSVAEGAFYPFSASAESPWYQFNDQRGDIIYSDKYKMRLNALNDPRNAKLDATFDAAHPFFKSSMKWPFLSYTEALFMKAECEQRTGAAATTATYTAAISASLAEFGVSTADATTYLAQPSVVGATTSLADIMTQKYIALYAQPEVYNDYRRTGFPALVPNVGSAIPTRLPYPQSESLYNSNTPSAKITDKVWWDVN